jgi:hypothetical protein
LLPQPLPLLPPLPLRLLLEAVRPLPAFNSACMSVVCTPTDAKPYAACWWRYTASTSSTLPNWGGAQQAQVHVRVRVCVRACVGVCEAQAGGL